MREKIVECSFLVPTVRDSDRMLHPPIVWRLLQDTIRKAFPKGHSGPEIFHKDVEAVPGEYEDDDTKLPVGDESRRYTIAIPSSKVKELRKLLKMVASTFDQKAIYLVVAGTVEFVEPDISGSTLWDFVSEGENNV